MPHWSHGPGPALQRDAEDVAALAGELHDRDPVQVELTLELLADLDQPQTVRTLDHERHVAAELLALQAVDCREDVELLQIGRTLAGEWERFNRAEFAAHKKGPSPVSADEGPKDQTHGNRTTSSEQLSLFGGDL